MRKKNALIVLVILALGLVGTVLSTLYQQNELIDMTASKSTLKVSYGFPLGWHGYSLIYRGWSPWGFPSEYWFSLGSLLLDATFWIAISFLVSLAAMKSVSILRKTRASKNLSVINI